MGLQISIIVPVLDEDARLRRFLEHLRGRAAAAEIILVGAVESPSVSGAATELCDRVLTARRGRASQMNVGANAARGDVFWFVHADSEVPRNCLEQIARALEDPRLVGGCFRIGFPRRELIYRVSNAVGNFAVELFGQCYGDRGIFCRRGVFEAVGGYPDLPLFEDAEFSRLMRRYGRVQQLRSKIATSTRRHEEIGPYRLTVSYWLLSTLYILRVPISVLARIYNRLCLCQNEPAHSQKRE